MESNLKLINWLHWEPEEEYVGIDWPTQTIYKLKKDWWKGGDPDSDFTTKAVEFKKQNIQDVVEFGLSKLGNCALVVVRADTAITRLGYPPKPLFIEYGRDKQRYLMFVSTSQIDKT